MKKRWIVLMIMLLCFNVVARAKINFNKVLMVGTVCTGAYFEATKEARPKGAYRYHEYSYASKALFFSTGILLGVEHLKEDGSMLKTIKNALALTMINWVVWERRYAEVAGNKGTYNSFPFDEQWIDTQLTWAWDAGRLIVGFVLYLM